MLFTPPSIHSPHASWHFQKEYETQIQPLVSYYESRDRLRVFQVRKGIADTDSLVDLILVSSQQAAAGGGRKNTFLL